MKQIIIYLLLALAFSVKAQTTFTQSIVPAIGDVHNYKIAKYNASLHNLTNTSGAGAIWNFNYSDSIINTLPQSLSINYSDTAGKLNGASVYPLANLSSNEGTATKYNFYSADANSLAYVGEAFYALGAYQFTSYNSNLDMMRFPTNFTDVFSDTAMGNWVWNNNNMLRKNISKTTYDGYGTLNINGNGGYAAHRVYTLQNITDTSLQVGGVVLAVYTKRNIYTFYDGLNKQPIIQVMTDSSRTVGAASLIFNSERVLVNSTILGLKESGSNSLNIFPNPVKDILTINLNGNGATFITICDIAGKTVERDIINVSNIKFNLNVSELASGSYFIKTENKGVVSQQRFIKL